ncbi:MAG: serine/threonine-protein kinase [Candidatus Melainabacteria bacterium]|nr:serine/threonine-protein kinase [Candidatus Melainabacteria bacterium]
MPDPEEKSPKDTWLEKLSNEPVSEEAMQDTWTRTVFVKGHPSSRRPAEEPAVGSEPSAGNENDATVNTHSIGTQPQDQSDPGDMTPHQPLTSAVADPLGDSNPDALIGQTVAEKYLINGFIGKGGMSAIYKVKHLQLDTELALKLLDKTMWADPTAVRRFKLEAQTVSKLTHPCLITYRDFGVTADGQPYLVMDYIQGNTLGQRIKQTRGIFLPSAIEIFEQLCEGLSVAHGLGIIHRDVKPGNIMFLDEEGNRLKLLDFGIAKIMSEEGEESQQLTRTGDVFGSPLYMSPEQCMGRRLDNRSDIYALGCVIFETMTGRHAISGNTILDTMNKHVSLMPSYPSELRPDLGSAEHASWVDVEEFEYIVMKCLQKNPNDRYKNVDDVLVDLRKLKAQQKIERDAPTATVKNLRRSSEKFDRTSPKEMFQMVATAAYILVGLGVFGAIGFIFVITNKPAPPPVPKPVALKARPTGPNQSIVIDNSARSQDSVELDEKAKGYMSMGQWSDAIDMLETSISMYKRQGKSALLIAPRYVDLANCYYNNKDFQNSLRNFKEAMSIYQQQNPGFCIPQMRESLFGQAKALRGMEMEKAAKEKEDEANKL